MDDGPSWFSVLQMALSAASPFAILLLQRSRAENERWRKEVRDDRQVLQKELADVKEITQDVQLRVERIEERGTNHEKSDQREFERLNREVEGLRRFWPGNRR